MAIFGKPEQDGGAERALPRHVAIIMDGNGRWAKQRGLPRTMGHKAGVDALRNIVRRSHVLGIEALTVYAFSTENWKRSAEEVGMLMRLILEQITREVEEMHAQNVRIRMLGDIEGMPEGLEKQKKALRDAEVRTQNNTGLQFNIAINYGGQQEIVRAAQRLAQRVQTGALDAQAIDAAAFERELYTADLPPVDYVIRTSGELRLSNFLLYQCAYAEFYITDTLWPDFDADAYDEALRAYTSRNRRFGGA